LTAPPGTLGASGLPVSRFGIGLAAIARPGYINLGRAGDLPAERSPEAMFERTVAVLDAARAAGVRYFDVARSYGRAEEFLAEWLRLRGVAPSETTIGSKWGYRYTAGWRVEAEVHEEKELSEARFAEQLAETRSWLRERLDLYQIHSATAESGVLDDEALLRALVAGRRRGDYRALGLTLSGPDSARSLERACALRLDGERVFDVVQATFNLLEPSLGGLLAAAHADGMGVIAKEVFANGRLSDANRLPGDVDLRDRLRALAPPGASLDQVAAAFVLAHPFVDVALSGAATVPQLDSHLAALRLDVEPAAFVALAEPPDRYWSTRKSLPWS
jgi:aryl-alcohol dehydrogenase-like predicted oxidoreductase